MANLGDLVKCMVTGFKGIVIGKSEFLHGCTRVGIQAPVGKDGKITEAQWIDEPQCKVIEAKKVRPGRQDIGGPIASVPTRVAGPK